MPSEIVVEPQHRLVTLLPPLTDTACAACIAFAATTVACLPNRHCLYVLSYGYITLQKYANVGFMGKKWSKRVIPLHTRAPLLLKSAFSFPKY